MLKSVQFFPHSTPKVGAFMLETDSFSADFQNHNFQGKRAIHVSFNVDLEKAYTDKFRVNSK